MNILEIKKLNVFVGEKQIIKNLDLKIKEGEVVAIMGPNGSGKSTLANVLLGHPGYRLASGKIIFADKDVTEKKPEERSALGMFLAFQSPPEIEGVELYPFLFDAHKSLSAARDAEAQDVFSFKLNLDKIAKRLKIKSDWSKRYLNHGFSGGEKKKSEILQMELLKPRLAIFDEIDSGLDVDALKVVGSALKRFKKAKTSALIVTHYPHILKYLPANRVLVMNKGKIVASGGPSLAKRLERQGFKNI